MTEAQHNFFASKIRAIVQVLVTFCALTSLSQNSFAEMRYCFGFENFHFVAIEDATEEQIGCEDLNRYDRLIEDFESVSPFDLSLN
ncbi:MAG: hypothetical protein HRT45_10235 [Bdellovibrionales bacterium]|nr:hypothetical protein [Bdellovibrionales bacterium]